ncbi:alpha/beta hydrolase family protein [Pseudoduganella namucuonensis]|uniref:Alpha/beta hydrolase family protein n=1 Tax=Pseudoduganella namucuonensis TaxID=1035707 RepID=A0A1I7LEB4_9BURK|nr:alpha/beta fold hydrolase [Pseudoduganella namucuonensis]SFV07916.1 Alpha/beta hydrolase family protein [Pseudoduganella namucuonensis]
MAELKLAVIDVKPGAAMESQSGLQMLRPRIYGAYAEPAGKKKIAAIVMHPASNFMGHYLLQPLAERGICCMGLNSRYVNNDSVLLMERVIQDLGAGVKFLREAGYEKVVLIGNSGGAALSSFYQAQAEQLTAHHFADGDPTGLSPEDLPPVDGIALCAAHEGRSRLLLDWIDPSVIDESDPLGADPALDMFNPANGPSYGAEFLARFRAGQKARRDRIEDWALARLRLLRANPAGPRDQAFVIYRTLADPRCLDLSLDANERAVGSVWGDARSVNYAGNSMGRYTSLTAFLSQWSSRSQADGPSNLARTSVPALLMTYTADASTFPSTRDAWLRAAGDRIRNIDIRGANHYLAGQPLQVERVADEIAAWARAL